MLNRNTIEYLKVINKVTDSVVLSYPYTVGNSDSGDIAFKIDISKLDTERFPSSLGICNLSSFLNMFNIFDDYNVSLDNKLINISDDNTSVNYILSNLELLENYNKIDPEIFDKISGAPSVLEFDLTVANNKKLRIASNSLSELNYIVIEGSDTPNISLVQGSSLDTSSNSIKINIPGISEKNFKVKFPIDTLLKLPVEDYSFNIKYSERIGKYRIFVKPVNSDILQIILPVEAI